MTMEMQMPKMLKLSKTDEAYGTYCPINCTTLMYDVGSGLICGIYDVSGGDNDFIESIDGNVIEIRKLNCKTYAEFIVALDLYGLVHDPNNTENIVKQYTTDQIGTLKKLVVENAKLKEKMKKLKSIFNSSRS